MKKVLIFIYRAIPAITLLTGFWLSPSQSTQWVVLITSMLLVYPIRKFEDNIFADDR